jgi:Protein of unknown function (DUF3631)
MVRYAPTDLLEGCPQLPVARPAQPVDVGNLVVAGGRGPTPELLSQLCRNPAFLATWNRQRGDLKDQSQSGYDLSLISQAKLAGLTDQDAVDLAIAHRAKTDEGPKSHNYYVRTLEAARRCAGVSPCTSTEGMASPRVDELAITLGDLVLEPKRWLPNGSIEVHVRQRDTLKAVERFSPGSSRSRKALIAVLRGLDPSIEDVGADAALMHLAERSPPQQAKPTQGLPGSTVAFAAVEPWPDSVDGALLAKEVEDTIHRFMVLKDAAAVLLVLWLIAAHVYDRFDIFPRILVRSPAKRCGKTRLLDLLEALLARAVSCANISLASVYRIIEEHHPALLLDETDRYLAQEPELIGVLNAGHKRGGRVIRCVGEDAQPRSFDVFAPLVLAGIGKAPDTLADRSFAIDMQRRAKGEEVSRMRARELVAVRGSVLPKIVRWAENHAQELADAEPEIPHHLDDRASDNALPLLAVADMLGGDWPRRARAAISQTCGIRVELDEGLGLLLLSDIRDLFDRFGDESLSTNILLRHLNEMMDRPWSEVSKRSTAMTGWHLGQALEQFGVRSTMVEAIRVGRSTSTGRQPNQAVRLRGYTRAQFETVWSRYLPPRPLRDSVRSTDAPVETAQHGEPSLRAGAVPGRSGNQPLGAQDGHAQRSCTESRSGCQDAPPPAVLRAGAEPAKPRTSEVSAVQPPSNKAFSAATESSNVRDGRAGP